MFLDFKMVLHYSDAELLTVTTSLLVVTKSILYVLMRVRYRLCSLS